MRVVVLTWQYSPPLGDLSLCGLAYLLRRVCACALTLGWRGVVGTCIYGEVGILTIHRPVEDSDARETERWADWMQVKGSDLSPNRLTDIC